VLAVPEPAHRFRLRRGLRVFLRKLYAAGCEKMANPVVAGLVRFTEPGIRNEIEGGKYFSSLRCSPLKVIIQHLFSARRVDLRSVRNHAVEIKQDRVVPVTVDHAFTLGLSHRSLSCYKGAPSTERQSLNPLLGHDSSESGNDNMGR